MTSSAPARRVLVILDPNYGDRLREVWPGCAVWIVMSPANESVVRSLWATVPVTDHLTGITGMTFSGGTVPESYLLSELGMIDLHHGPYSSANPYMSLEVIGLTLTAATRGALSELGFTTFAENGAGFIASRSEKTPNELGADRASSPRLLPKSPSSP